MNFDDTIIQAENAIQLVAEDYKSACKQAIERSCSSLQQQARNRYISANNKRWNLWPLIAVGVGLILLGLAFSDGEFYNGDFYMGDAFEALYWTGLPLAFVGIVLTVILSRIRKKRQKHMDNHSIAKEKGIEEAGASAIKEINKISI